MTEIRCVKCNRLLMKAQMVLGEVKCPKCGYINKVMTNLTPRKLAEIIYEHEKIESLC